MLGCSPTPVHGLNFYINYSPRPDHAALVAHDLSIVNAEAKIDLPTLRRLGRRVFAYLSVVEVAPDARYRDDFLKRKIPRLATNEVWKSELADVSTPAWRDYVVNTLATGIMGQDFDGFFLDTPDSVDLLTEKYPARAEAFREGLIQTVRALKARFPGKQIIYNRGFSTWEKLKDTIDGVLVESMFHTIDFKTQKYLPVSKAASDEIRVITERIKAAGLPVYVADYVDPQNAEVAFETARKIEAAGYHAFVTTPELDGEALAPLRLTPRHVLVLFGSPPDSGGEEVKWPSDTTFALTTQTPLEWLGYEADYLDAVHHELPERLESKYAAVITERFLTLPKAKESSVAAWLIKQKQLGKRIIFLGGLPTEAPEVLKEFLPAFGLQGSGASVSGVQDLKTLVSSPLMGFEAPVLPLPTHFFDLRAPADAKVHYAVQASEPGGEPIRYDAVFTTSWGGAAFDPCLFFRRPDYTEFWLPNPFDFLAAALGRADLTPVPAPDATTRDGVRLFFTHIDGDGFRHNSSAVIGKVSGEVILERIIKKYPYPFTCSVIEAEIRALVVGQKTEDEPRLTAIAREMFALPKVEAASHSFSHPFFWITGDKTSRLYDEQNLKLKPEFDPAEINLHQEIIESVHYIEQKLLPPDKKVAIFLWSGNCRPPPEALRLCREAGMENMNGGMTIVSRGQPSITKAAPRTMPWDDELLIHAVVDNDNVYQQRGTLDGEYDLPFLAGFMHTVETFERTDSPRRLKPVNIYFHFYSGDSQVALKALTRAFDWTMDKELHATTAAAYARLARDCRQTLVFQAAPDRWVLANNGQLRTYRLPKTEWLPDLAASKGITGYRETTNAVYVHTDGSARVELALSRAPAPQLHLVSSTADIQFATLASKNADFTVQDTRECQVVLGGLPPGAEATITVNGETRKMSVNPAGRLELKLPAIAKVSVQST